MCTYGRRDAEFRTTPRINPGAANIPAAHPAATSQERTTPSCSPFGARMQWPEPAHTEQSLACLVRPTKGGAVRIRIALATAMAARHSSTRDLFLVFQQYVRSLDVGPTPRGDQPTPDGEDRRHADVVFPSPVRREAGGLFQRPWNWRREETYLTEFAYLEVTRGGTAVSEGNSRHNSRSPRKQHQPRRHRHR